MDSGNTHPGTEQTQRQCTQRQSGPRDRADPGTAGGGTEWTPRQPTHKQSGLRDRRPKDRADPEIAHLQTEYTQGQSKPSTADSETADLEREQPEVLGIHDECGIRESSPRIKQTQGWSRLRTADQYRANTVTADPGGGGPMDRVPKDSMDPGTKMHQRTREDLWTEDPRTVDPRQTQKQQNH